MQKSALPVLFGLVLCTVFAECLIYSSLCFVWEADNLDGSSSITWRSGIVLLLLVATTQWISRWIFRHRIALRVLLGLAIGVAIETWLLCSSYSFCWEARNSDGTFLLTWRSDLVIFLLLSTTQGLSFLAFSAARLPGRKRISTTSSQRPNI